MHAAKPSASAAPGTQRGADVAASQTPAAEASSAYPGGQFVAPGAGVTGASAHVMVSGQDGEAIGAGVNGGGGDSSAGGFAALGASAHGIVTMRTSRSYANRRLNAPAGGQGRLANAPEPATKFA